MPAPQDASQLRRPTGPPWSSACFAPPQDMPVHAPFICPFVYWIFSMPRTLPTLCLVLAASGVAAAQTPPPPPGPQPPAATLTLTLDDALARARVHAQQLLSADLAARIS